MFAVQSVRTPNPDAEPGTHEPDTDDELGTPNQAPNPEPRTPNYSDRSAPTSGPRNAAFVAITDDTSPAASTASNSSELCPVSGAAGAAVGGGRGNGHERAHGADNETCDEEQEILTQHDREQVSRPVADGAQERQLTAPLEDVAQHDRREPDRTDQQTETAERLKRRQIGVLDGVERRQPFGREHGIGAKVTS